MERFKEWLGYCGSVLFLEFCSLFVGMGWLPAIGLEVLGVISGEHIIPVTVSIMAALLLIVPIFLMIKEHGFPRFTGSYAKTFLAILISFTIGLVAGTESFIDLSSVVTSITKGGYDAGYDEGYKKGISSNNNTSYSKGFSQGYDRGYNEALEVQQILGEMGLKAAPQQSKTVETVVYVTSTGSKYHEYGCQYLRQSCHEINLSDARDRGYTPCSKCY